jgi:hypothetical protein
MKCFDDVEFDIATLSSFEPLIDNLSKAILWFKDLNQTNISNMNYSEVETENDS